MNKSEELLQTQCLNCGTSVKGAYCHQCGQRLRDNLDRSLGRLMGEFFGTIFFFDNRFFVSIKHLFGFPGSMTVKFLEGKRKKFISPVTLFLLINLIYFFVNPLTDYSISLYDQTRAQPYSQLTKVWLDQKLQNEELEEGTFSIVYQRMSDSVSKSVMIINVPIIAFFVYLMAFKKRPFYFDSLIFAFHFFSLFLVSWIMLYWADVLFTFIPSNFSSTVSYISFYLFSIVIPLCYAVLSAKKFMRVRWYWAVPAGFAVIISVILTNIIYRFIIFCITLLII